MRMTAAVAIPGHGGAVDPQEQLRSEHVHVDPRQAQIGQRDAGRGVCNCER